MGVSAKFKVLFGILVGVSLAFGSYVFFTEDLGDVSVKMNGIGLESPPRPIDSGHMHDVRATGAKWVAVIPYGISLKESPRVHFNHPRQWWGEGISGAAAMIQMVHEASMQVMLKPQVWTPGGWIGSFSAADEAGWQAWEEDYRAYILDFAKLADSLDVGLFCIGTEYRLAVQERPEFWRDLIGEVRTVYGGKITYSANWDDYPDVPFWDALDYIGISAYFPIARETNPSDQVLDSGWEPLRTELQAFSQSHKKPILFTEYGYRSAEGAAVKPWEESGGAVDLDAQTRAYAALYRNIWQEPWFAGGFLWKWQFREGAGGIENGDFTPQGKPALEVIKEQYSN
jgi:hypothetical protein